MSLAQANGHADRAGQDLLLPQHAEQIAASAIAPEVAAARGYRSARTRAELAELGFDEYQQLVPTLIIPLHTVDGEVGRYAHRPDAPRVDAKGKTHKYEFPRGKPHVLDVPPSARNRILESAEALWITEGSKKADAAVSAGLACLGIFGTYGWVRKGKRPLEDFDRIPLKGRRVYVVFDSDVAIKREVQRALEDLLAFLIERGAEPRIVYLPAGEADAKTGLDDFLAGGGTRDDLLELAARELRTTSAPEGAGRPPSLAKRLVDHAMLSGAEFFHTPTDEPYATVPVGEHRATLPVRSGQFELWLGGRAHADGLVPSASAVKDAQASLAARALYDGAEHPVSVRVGGSIEDAVYIDLGDPTRRAIEIQATGWRLVDEPPVKFRRTGVLQALAEPERGGTIDELRAYINVPDDRWALLLAWTVVALLPCGGYPLLVLHGEQGAAKSTTARLLKALVDPTRPDLRGEPDTVNNLMLAASNNRVLAFDNLSSLGPQLSDALCRISTGGGHAVRALYTNNEEAVFEALRPLVVTGIDAVPARADLLERCLLLELPRIDPTQRQTDRALWTSFNAARGRILGALLDGAVSALARRDQVQLAATPRMAEFAELATAAEPGLGLRAGAVMAAYDANRDDAAGTALEASPLWPLLRDFADEQARTAGELLAALNARADDGTRHRRGWPSAPHRLSHQLTRLATPLRDAGIEIRRGSDGRGNTRSRTIALVTQGGPELSDPSDPSDPAQQTREIPGAHGGASSSVGALSPGGGVTWGRLGSLPPPGKTPGSTGMGSLGSLGSLPSGQLDREEGEAR